MTRKFSRQACNMVKNARALPTRGVAVSYERVTPVGPSATSHLGEGLRCPPKHLHMCAKHLHMCAKHLHMCAKHLHMCAKHLHMCAKHLHMCAKHLHMFAKHLHMFEKHLHMFEKHLHMFFRGVYEENIVLKPLLYHSYHSLCFSTRALPTERKVESGTSQSKRGTSVDLGK